MFLALGLTNVRRNMGRSALAVVGAALAAMIMTSIIALSGGYPAMGYRQTRAFLGADIMVYGTPHLVAPGALQAGPGADDPWGFVQLARDNYCDLVALHPELYARGFLSAGAVDLRPIEPAELARRLAGNRHVQGISPAYFLPVRAVFIGATEDGDTQTVQLPEMVLRGRDFGFGSSDGHWSFEQLLSAGRMPVPGEMAVGLVDARLRSLGYRSVPEPGTTLQLFVPAVSVDEQGRLRIDYSRETELSIEIVGQYEVQSNVAFWSNDMGDTMQEDLYWTTPQIQVPMAYFAAMFAQVSSGQSYPGVMQAGINVSPFSEVENIAAELRALLPEFTVISVPSQINLAHSRGLPEASFRAPLEALGSPTMQQVGMPVDLSQAFIILVCLIAALLLASNMLFLVAQRRREIGVLKALGARSSDIGLMILSEALTLNLIGTLAGFLVIRVFATWTLVSNRIPLAEIGRATLVDLAIVVSAAASAAALFALVPAVQMARLTSMEVLRNE